MFDRHTEISNTATDTNTTIAHAAGWAYGQNPSPPPNGYPAEWRALDASIWRWVRAHGGSPVLAWAAAWASWAEGQGHTALDLGRFQMPPLNADDAPTDWAERLTAEQGPWLAVSANTAPPQAAATPFVLQGQHFYLRRNALHEQHIAQLLQARLQASAEGAYGPPLCPVTAEDLAQLFAPDAAGHDGDQRRAVQAAVGQRLLVLTGGPGTGKTTTVLRILLALSREHLARHGQLPRLHLAAPTGKAAQRLGESLRQGAAALQAQQLPAAWQPHSAAVQQALPATVHRLLGAGPQGWQYHADAPLPTDVLVVDEASMLDLELLQALLLALPPQAVLLLVGDADQLSSVGTGSVLMNLVQALDGSASPALLRLKHCFRADAGLQPLLQAVRGGHWAQFQQAWQAAGPAVAQRQPISTAADLQAQLQPWAQALAQLRLQAGLAQPFAADDAAGISAALAAQSQQQLLCAMKIGPFGAEACNADIEAALRQHLLAHGAAAQGPWFAGRSIMVAQNHASLGLFNGDIGLCISLRLPSGGHALRVAFAPTPEQAAQGHGPRLLEPASLPAFAPAYALTIHKSQGSEYGQVAVLLPPGGHSPLLTQQSLYTALSRAKQKVAIWSDDTSLQTALQHRLERHGLLAQRLVV